MPEMRAALSTEMIESVATRPPVDLTHSTWGEVFMQDRNGAYLVTPADAVKMLHEAFISNRQSGLSFEEAFNAEQIGYHTARAVPALIEAEHRGLAND
jgi:hypothetical protein